MSDDNIICLYYYCRSYIIAFLGALKRKHHTSYNPLVQSFISFTLITAIMLGVLNTSFEVIAFSRTKTVINAVAKQTEVTATIKKENKQIKTCSAKVLQNNKTAASNKTKKQVVNKQTANKKVAKKVEALVPPLAVDYTGNPFHYPQCVWYVWGRAKAVTGVALQFKTNFGRSAKRWLSQIKITDGVAVNRDPKAIKPQSIAVFSQGGEGNGHVLFVEDVLTDKNGNPYQVVISESNWGTNKPQQKKIQWNEFLARSNGSLEGYIYL